MAGSLVQIEQHQAERRRRAVTTMYGCGCSCCCCCCCLHSLGSLIGAAIAPTAGTGAPMTLTDYYDDEAGDLVPDVRKPGISAVAVHWWIVAALCAASFVVPISGESIGLAVCVFAFPALQLASVFVTLVIIAVWPRPDKMYQLRQLGKITLGMILGTLAGLLVMAVLFGGFMAAVGR